MAQAWTAYRSRPVLLDVTVPAMAPNGNIQSPSAGSYSKGGSTIQVTTNSINSLNVVTGNLYDATELEIISPVDANGTFPDVEITFTVDNTDLKGTLVIDGSADTNMFPVKKNMVGQRYIKLGMSLRDLLSKGQIVPNLPVLATGLKVKNSITVTVSSVAGWGQTGTALTPMRIVLRGDILTAGDIDQYTGLYNASSSVSLQTLGSHPFFIPNLQVPSLSSAWQTLPGGGKQTNTKINRRFTYSSNQAQITTANNFVFSQLPSVQGSQGNVLDSQHDLGDDFTQNANAFLYKEFGLRLAAGVQGYLGFRIDGTIVPQETPQGTPVSTGWNDFQYGSVQPLRTESNLYYPIPDSKNFVDLLVYGQAVAPFFRAAGSDIAIGDVTIVKGGVQIEQAG